ncbi:hypothetical protein PROFUN_09070 [Planoprotostelium fungivorum]|uniref:Potassium channel tetramerisation-type BTB domain-containing protein n=1 Tax=Planoprotostelium fungivorum TaxID=1890364 RepID=A0A2P6NIF0_9EUKA|nr:hypothetical protein PROFUN_09070 [Planoprotostelium fungivorum]
MRYRQCPDPSEHIEPIKQGKRNKMSSVADRTYEHLRELKEECARYEKECLAELQLLEEKTLLYKEMRRQKREKLDSLPSQILLNVGGQKLRVEKSTVMKREWLLSEMLSRQPDEKGQLFLDRDVDNFERVIDYLQKEGEVNVTAEEVEELEFFWLYPAERVDRNNAAKRRKTEDTEQSNIGEKSLMNKCEEMERMRMTVRRETKAMEQAVERKKKRQKEAEEYIEELRETIKLDVRGKQYMTTKKTLQRGGEGSMLSVLASGRWTAETAAGYKIDRNSRSFAMVLDYLRTGRRAAGETVAEELAYFGIDVSVSKSKWSKRMWTEDARCTTTFIGHTGCVYSVIELNNGHIVTCSSDKTVKIWTLDGTCTATFSGHTHAIFSVAELNNGQIASGSIDGSVKIWTLDGTCTATLSGQTDNFVCSVTKLSNGQIASGSTDNTINIWTPNGTCTDIFCGHTDDVNSVTELSNGQIASGSKDKTIKIWRLDGTCTATLHGHTSSVFSVIELSNGHIASGSDDMTVKIWTQDGTCTATFSGHRYSVTSVVELSNGQIASGSGVSSVVELCDGQIASGSNDGTTKIWTR